MNPEEAAQARDLTLARLPSAVLWGGTLLGHIRERRIMPWDKDVDIAVPFDDFTPLDGVEYRRARWEPWMSLHVEQRPHGNIGYMVGDVKVGAHLLMGSGDWRYYTRYPGQLVKVPNPTPARIIDGLPCPGDPHRTLAWLYGRSWRTPRHPYIGTPAHKANVARWLVKKPAVVYCDGVWDLFHEGHRRLLKRARGYGRRLVVGVKSDAATLAAKGRAPVWSEADRMAAVAAFADEVILYAESTIMGDVFVHGDDWHTVDRTRQVADAAARGVPIVLLPRTPGVSSTGLRT